MFEIIQERDHDKEMAPRTIIFVIAHGESEELFSEKLTDQGKQQVTELARSRVVSGVSRIYSSSGKVALESAGILRKEFDVPVEVKDCLSEVKLGKGKMEDHELADVLQGFWDDPHADIKKGESSHQAQKRFGDCLNKIVSDHPNDSIAIVSHPIINTLLQSLVMGGISKVEDWLYSGYCSCASYEVSKKSWTQFMPIDDSFLTQPCQVIEKLPPAVRERFGV